MLVTIVLKINNDSNNLFIENLLSIAHIVKCQPDDADNLTKELFIAEEIECQWHVIKYLRITFIEEKLWGRKMPFTFLLIINVNAYGL